MKKYISTISLLLIISNCVFAQNVESTISATSHLPYSLRQSTTISHNGTVVIAGFDTLTSTDTGYVQFFQPNKYNQIFELSVTSLTGTLAGTAVLMGASGTSMPSPTSNLWHILTGSTTYCAGCAGASATLSGSGTTNYEWHMPYEGCDYTNFQVRSIVTGTCTATYKCTDGYKK